MLTRSHACAQETLHCPQTKVMTLATQPLTTPTPAARGSCRLAHFTVPTPAPNLRRVYDEEGGVALGDDNLAVKRSGCGQGAQV